MSSLFPDLTTAEQQLSALMVGSAVAVKTWPEGTFNPTTGTWTDPTGTVLYTGPALFRALDQFPGRRVLVGEAVEERTQWRLTLPKTATPITGAHVAAGVLVTITVCERDPSLVGRVFRLDRVAGSALAIARRYSMVEYVAAEPRRPGR